MKRICIFCLIIILAPVSLFAQSGRKQIEEGNKLYVEEKFDAANDKYRDALNEDPLSPVIHYNLGNVSYKKKNFEEALKSYEKSLSAEDVLTQSKVYYNEGNTLFRMGKLPESILAYKKALELNPDDIDAKYNLEYVRALLKDNAEKQPQQQQNQQQQQQQQQQDKNQEDQQDKQQQQEEQQKDQQQQEQEQQSQTEPVDKKEMSKEEAERLLDALQDSEKELQKNRKAKGRGQRRVLKDW